MFDETKDLPTIGLSPEIITTLFLVSSMAKYKEVRSGRITSIATKNSALNNVSNTTIKDNAHDRSKKCLIYASFQIDICNKIALTCNAAD